MQGERRQEDLSELFLWLRTNTGGSFPAVKDVGDFCAHREGRDAGQLWERGRDLACLFPFEMRMPGEVIDTEILREAPRAMLRLLGPKRAREITGLALNKATKTLDSAVKKFETIDGEPRTTEPLSGEERRVLEAVTRAQGRRVAYTQQELFLELKRCLLQRGLLDQADVNRFDNLSQFVALFAISRMHLRSIKLGSGVDARLIANTSPHDSKSLRVVMAAPAPGTRVQRAMALFSTTCDVFECCAPELHPSRWDQSWVEGMGDWDAPIELGLDGKLRPLRAV